MVFVLDRLHEVGLEWGKDPKPPDESSTVKLYHVLIVDDGSTDGTVVAIKSWMDRVSNSSKGLSFKFSILSHSARKGYGAALKTGIASADSDYIAFYDADGTYDPGLLPEMVRLLETNEADMVCGDRLSRCDHMPLIREVGNRLFVGTINMLYRTRVYDSCTGMRVFTKRMQPFFLSSTLPNGLDYSLAMTLSFLRTGQKLLEVPIPYASRIGRSKLHAIIDGPRFFIRILASWVHASAQLKQIADERRQLLQSRVISKKR